MTNREWDLYDAARVVEFLQTYCTEQIERLQVGEYDGAPTVEVSLLDLARYQCGLDLERDPLAERIRTDTNTVVGWFEQTLRTWVDSVDEVFDAAEGGNLPLRDAESWRQSSFTIELVNHELPDDVTVELSTPPTSLYRDIGAPRGEHIGRLVAFEGICKQVSDPKPRIIETAFRCVRCGTQTDTIDMTHTFDPENAHPTECEGCDRQGPFEPVPRRQHRAEYQQVRVQEPPEEAINSSNPREIVCDVMGEHLIDRVEPGDRVTTIGILRDDADTESTLIDTRLEVVGLVPEEVQFEEVEFTDEDIEQIEALAETEDLFDLLTRSVAPSIYGNEDAKRGVALQLFGGVTRTIHGNRKRGEIHIMFIGDPGVGKSQILESARTIAPRSVSSSGTGSSAVGLTATAVKEEIGGEKQWTLQAGSLVLADGGLITIDELDNMREDQQQALDEALSEGTVTVDKADTHAQLKARCTALMAANPAEGRFNQYDAYPEQFDMPKELLDRCDLIFTFRDTPEDDHDEKVAEQILDNHSERKRAAADGSGVVLDDHGVVPPDLYRKYVAYARRNHDPDLTTEARDRLKDWYLTVRDELSSDVQVAINSRVFEGAIRLAQASARARLSDDAEMEDAERAIDLVMESLSQAARDPDGEGFDIDMIAAGKAAPSQERKYDAIVSIVGESEGESPANLGSVLHEAADYLNTDERTVEKHIEHLKDKGRLYEPSDGKLRTT